jgi:hypothetical protein
MNADGHGFRSPRAKTQRAKGEESGRGRAESFKGKKGKGLADAASPEVAVPTGIEPVSSA